MRIILRKARQRGNSNAIHSVCWPKLMVGDAYGPEVVMFGTSSAQIRDLGANMGATATGESGSEPPAAACARSLFRFPGSSNP